MIDKLVHKHDLWVKMAREICKDSYLADDLVSEMYLKLANTKRELNEYYVYLTIKHRYIDYLKEQARTINIDYLQDIAMEEETEAHIDIELPDCITWVEKQILLLRQEKSGRDIEKQYHINFQKVHRIEKKAKEKLEQWAKTFVVPATL